MRFKETDTFKDVLDAIDEWAGVATSDNCQKLWDILTALRGPDEEHRKYLKDTTTAVIRREALPNLAREYADVAGNSIKFSSDRTQANMFDHFLYHVYHGYQALCTPQSPGEDSDG